MLFASLVICAVATGDCMTFKDERGPYATEVACVARLEEILTPADNAFVQVFGSVNRQIDAQCSPQEPKIKDPIALPTGPLYQI